MFACLFCAVSVQQLVDCAPNNNNCGGEGGTAPDFPVSRPWCSVCADVLFCGAGCEGSTAPLAFDYLISAGGMSIEWAYPYVDYWYSREPAVHKCTYNNDDALADGSVGAVLDGYVVVEVRPLLLLDVRVVHSRWLTLPLSAVTRTTITTP